MKKALLICLAIMCTVLVCVSCTQNAADTNAGTESETQAVVDDVPKEFTINSISAYNIESEVDSHKDEWKNSHLEQDYRERFLVDTSLTGTKELWYPRIKQTANGEYILLFMNGQTGNHIYISRSKDLKTWYGTERLFEGSAATSTSPLYASADAIVLQNGDILAAAGFRGYKTYKGDSKTNGIQIRRSTDNGATWSKAETVYTGGVWEPSLLQLKSGEIQLYWTNTHVGGAPAEYGGRTDDNSTGTAMLRSFDNGYTWNNNIEVPYTAQVVAQQYTKTGSDGKYYSGQMPVAWQLNNGTIVLALEVRYGKDGDSTKTYNMSFAYSPGENSWPAALGSQEEGPTTLVKNAIMKAAGPYIRQFKSGETVLSYHWGSDWFTLVGNSTATKFNDRMESFGPDTAMSIWGSTEVIGTHTIIGTAPSSTKTAIHIGKFNLNHTIEAVEADVKVDGYLDEWSGADQAFFIGSETQAQTSIRVMQDDENIYFAAEVLDYFITDGDKVLFTVGDHNTGKYLNLAVSAEGKVSVNKGSIKIDASDAEAAVLINGTVGDNKDRDKGYVIELKIPKSIIGDTSTLIFCPALYNKDKASDTVIDRIGIMEQADTSDWLKIKL